MLTHPHELAGLLGPIDLFWLDQILKGNVNLDEPVLDAGCGSGKNSQYLIKLQAPVFGIDQDTEVIRSLKGWIQDHHPKYPLERFSEADIQSIPFENEFFSSICCIAVLHFARNENHFFEIMSELWRVLKKDGILVLRYFTALAANSNKEVNFLPQLTHLREFIRLNAADEYHSSHRLYNSEGAIQTAYLRKKG